MQSFTANLAIGTWTHAAWTTLAPISKSFLHIGAMRSALLRFAAVYIRHLYCRPWVQSRSCQPRRGQRSHGSPAGVARVTDWGGGSTADGALCRVSAVGWPSDAARRPSINLVLLPDSPAGWMMKPAPLHTLVPNPDVTLGTFRGGDAETGSETELRRSTTYARDLYSSFVNRFTPRSTDKCIKVSNSRSA